MRERHHTIDRLQFEEAIAGYDGSRSAEANRVDVLIERAEKAEAELAKCRRSLESSRAQQIIDREHTKEVAADRDALRATLSKLFASNEQLRRNWYRASTLLRMLPPETLAELRSERDARQHG